MICRIGEADWLHTAFGRLQFDSQFAVIRCPSCSGVVIDSYCCHCRNLCSHCLSLHFLDGWVCKWLYFYRQSEFTSSEPCCCTEVSKIDSLLPLDDELTASVDKFVVRTACVRISQSSLSVDSDVTFDFRYILDSTIDSQSLH